MKFDFEYEPARLISVTERKAGAVINSMDKNVVMSTLIYTGSEFRIKNLEMIKVGEKNLS